MSGQEISQMDHQAASLDDWEVLWRGPWGTLRHRMRYNNVLMLRALSLSNPITHSHFSYETFRYLSPDTTHPSMPDGMEMMG